MTKSEAHARGYCKHCAAWGDESGWRCGVTMPAKINDCRLPAEAVERWRGEFGLDGETQRCSGAFGDRELMKKNLGRKEKRYIK